MQPSIFPYIQIARPDHWFKNIFMLPGMCLALLFTQAMPESLHGIVSGVFSACLIASANYSINEYLDGKHDKQHPTKYLRPAAQGLISFQGLVIEYALLAAAGLLLGFSVNNFFGCIAAFFLAMGFCYNVPPIRTKDVPYVDVISESINNPIRLVLGWAIFIPGHFPPGSFILAYWTAGAFLMTLKRYAEFRTLGSIEKIRGYRISLAGYTEQRLLVAAVFYAMNTAFFLGISLIKYKIEFLLLFPFVALLFSWYLSLSMSPSSVVQTPEKLYKEKRFIVYVTLITLLLSAFCFLSLPQLNFLLEVSRFN